MKDEKNIPIIQITQEPKTLPREYFETIVYRWLIPIPIISGLFNLALNKIIKHTGLLQILPSIGASRYTRNIEPLHNERAQAIANYATTRPNDENIINIFHHIAQNLRSSTDTEQVKFFTAANAIISLEANKNIHFDAESTEILKLAKKLIGEIDPSSEIFSYYNDTLKKELERFLVTNDQAYKELLDEQKKKIDDFMFSTVNINFHGSDTKFKSARNRFEQNFPIDAKGKGQNQVSSYERYFAKTKDNVLLDSIKICPLGTNNNSTHIIYFGGNNEIMEDGATAHIDIAKSLEKTARMVFFNYREVGNSTGEANSSNDFVKDGYAQVQKLIDEGVDPKNIVLFGHSIGAGIAAVLAEKLHAEKDDTGNSIKPVKIFNDRSYSSVSAVLPGTIQNPIARAIVHGFIKFGLFMSGYEINAAESFRNIPDQYKEYTFVRSTDKNTDEVITHYGSLHAAVKDDYKKTPKPADTNSAEYKVYKNEQNKRKLENVGHNNELIQAQSRPLFDLKSDKPDSKVSKPAIELLQELINR